MWMFVYISRTPTLLLLSIMGILVPLAVQQHQSTAPGFRSESPYLHSLEHLQAQPDDLNAKASANNEKNVFQLLLAALLLAFLLDNPAVILHVSNPTSERPAGCSCLKRCRCLRCEWAWSLEGNNTR